MSLRVWVVEHVEQGLPGRQHLNQVLFRRARLLAPPQAGEDAVLLEEGPAGCSLDFDHLRLLDIGSGRNGVEV